MGGTPLVSGALIQSLSISIPFERTDLYGLGSNHVYGRKLKLPIRATVDLSAIVQNMSSGTVNQLQNNEDTYDFSIQIVTAQPNSPATGLFQFSNAKVNSFNYSMAVNGTMQFSASYSVEITSETGLRISSPPP
jgi:hypothetical protein